MTFDEASEAAGRLIAARGSGQPHNPKAYIAAIAAVLMQYPRATALAASDPVNGIARECHFLPEIADVATWCANHEPAPKGAGLAAKMFQERAEAAEWAEKRKTRPTYQELKEKYQWDQWLPAERRPSPWPKPPTDEELRARYPASPGGGTAHARKDREAVPQPPGPSSEPLAF